VAEHFTADSTIIFGDGHDALAKHKPGLRRSSDQAALDAKAQAYADSVAEMCDAWRKPVDDRRKKTFRDPQGREAGTEEEEDSAPRTMDAATAQRIRDEAWQAMVDELYGKGQAR
jgi:hypothetical protein